MPAAARTKPASPRRRTGAATPVRRARSPNDPLMALIRRVQAQKSTPEDLAAAAEVFEAIQAERRAAGWDME